MAFVHLVRSVSALGPNLRLTAGMALLAFASCAKPPPPVPPPAPVPVTVVPVVQRDVPRYLNSIGYATAFEAVAVVAQVDGKILQIHFTQGAPVKKGDVLYDIDPRPYQAKLDEANGQLADDQAALQIAQLQVERARPLAASDLVAKQTFDTYTAQVKEIQAKIDGDNGTILAAQVNLDYCTIRSPVDGIAGFYNVNAGNVVFAKNQTVLTTIQQVAPIYLDFTVTGAELPDVQARFAAANGSLPMLAAYLARDDTWRDATLKFLSNKVDQVTGTVLVRGLYPNTDQHFWPGEAIRTQLILETLKGALLIPSRALALGQDGSYVFVKAADNTVARRLVKTGQHEDDDIVVTDGLQAGESVVVTGQFMLKPGDKVKVVTPLSGNIGGVTGNSTAASVAPAAANPTPASAPAAATTTAAKP